MICVFNFRTLIFEVKVLMWGDICHVIISIGSFLLVSLTLGVFLVLEIS